MGALKELGNALAENAAKAPGWLPLLVLCYVGFMFVSEGATLLGFPLKAHEELIVPMVTLVLYVLGDLLDKPLFKCLKIVSVEKSKQDIKGVLDLKEGTYRVSMALATASKKRILRWIQFQNEFAKFLRSLVLPSAGLGVFFLIRCQAALWGAAFAGANLFCVLYILLKSSHKKGLYRLSEELSRDGKYEAYNLPNGVRLFFWEGELVGSGDRKS